MNRSARGLAVVVVAAVAAVAAFLKRPVRRPADAGRWEPVERGVPRRR